MNTRPYALIAAAIGISALVVASFATLNLQWGAFLQSDAARLMGDFTKGFLSPDFSSAFVARVGFATLQTFAMSLLSTVIASACGAAIALPASGRHGPMRAAARTVLNVLRSVPELIWAAIFVIAVGLGPFAGVLALSLHTTGVLGRLFAETIENAAPAPRTALADNGARRAASFLYATLPQALPQAISYVLYRWENNIRAATILGIVGAGGLGQMLFYYVSLFQTDRVSTVVIAMIGLVLVVDYLSARLRRWCARSS